MLTFGHVSWVNTLQIKTNHQLPMTNQLTLSVLDIDAKMLRCQENCTMELQ